MLKLSVAGLFLGGFLAQAAPSIEHISGIPAWLIQFGALGIVAYVIHRVFSNDGLIAQQFQANREVLERLVDRIDRVLKDE